MKDKKHLMITIGREVGSGGHDIAKLLAEKLGLPFYDNELITLAAKESGLGEAAFRRSEQVATNTFEFALSAGSAAREYGMTMNDRMFMIQSDLIRSIADRESAVIVGRCSDSVLEDYMPCVNIFISADMEHRIGEVRAREGFSANEAKRFIQKMDKYRATYYNFYTTGKWGDRRRYDLCIDRTGLTTEQAADLIASYVAIRRQNLEAE